MSKTALVVGATGLVGNLVVDKLVNDSTFSSIVILTRKSLGKSNPKIKEVLVDFDQLDQHTDAIKADCIFCCLGTTIKKAGSQEAFKKVDYEYPLRVAEIAKQNGATTYVLISALGASENSIVFYNRVKGAIQKAIQKISFETFHILQPSLIIGERNEKRLGEGIAQKLSPLLDTIMVGGLSKYKSITAEQIATAMVHYSKLSDKGMYIHDSLAIKNLT